MKSVLLHRPGRELDTLAPQYLEELLFDDIPWLDRLQEEHDLFAQTLTKRGCEVLYYHRLLEEVLKDRGARKNITDAVLAGSLIPGGKLTDDIRELLSGKTEEALAEILIGGLRKEEVPHTEDEKRLSYYIKNEYPYYIHPLPNLYFTRDPGVVIADGMAVNAMKTRIRSRETIILDAIRAYHPRFAEVRKKRWYSPEDGGSIEGGDVLVLSADVVAVGCSARTSSEGIEKMAERLLLGESGVREVLAIQIPNARAYMHLDTVFTMLDFDAFTIFPGIEAGMRMFHLTLGGRGNLCIRESESLSGALKKSLNLPAVRLIHTGGKDGFIAAREQWNDSANTLALAPGVVITYKRNVHSNEILRRAGIEVVGIEGSELVRGRGGPRCMSMPLLRERL